MIAFFHVPTVRANGTKPPSISQHPSRGCCSYFDYYRQRFERDRGLKIDFVLGSPALAERVTHAFIDREERDPATFAGAPSDHAPVVVDLSS